MGNPFRRKVMKWFITQALLFIMVILANGCAVRSSNLFPPEKDADIRTIFLVSHGWHAGIVVQRGDIRQSDWPRLDPFDNMEYLEIGWGDRDYYTSPEPGPGLAAKALLLPSTSVLHVVGFRIPPENYFPYSEIIRIDLSVPGFEQMIHQISKSFMRDESGSAMPLGRGSYGYSQFYASVETYHLCKTCNTWTATMLQVAGCPVNATSTVDGLMAQTRRLGKLLQEESEPQ